MPTFEKHPSHFLNGVRIYDTYYQATHGGQTPEDAGLSYEEALAYEMRGYREASNRPDPTKSQVELDGLLVLYLNAVAGLYGKS